MEITFQLIAAVLIGVAAYSYYTDWPDALFASVVLAVCSMFIAYRYRLKSRVSVRDAIMDEDTDGDG